VHNFCFAPSSHPQRQQHDVPPVPGPNLLLKEVFVAALQVLSLSYRPGDWNKGCCYLIPWSLGVFDYTSMAESSKVFFVSWLDAQYKNKRAHGCLMCKNCDLVRSLFARAKICKTSITNPTSLLKHGIPHATFNCGFWGFDGMGPSEVHTIYKSFKLKGHNVTNYYKKRCI